MASVLIVDDEFGLAEAVSEALLELGHHTATAINGRLGLAACTKARPDLILLDVMMPVVTGLEMLAQLKRDQNLRDIPVVMMSTTGREAIPGSMQPHLRGFLHKPFTLDELRAVVDRILKGSAPQ